MQEDGIPPFLLVLASMVLIVGVVIAGTILTVVLLMPAK